jgi:DNA-binding response OmpR family regulator
MKHILMIEDDTTLQDVYKDAFHIKDFTLTIAGTGKEGLEKALERVDLIVLDIMLPGGMNGFDVLGELKKNPKTLSIPVLVLTNLDSEQHTALDMGASGYLVKANTSIDEVIAKVKSLV